MGWNPTFEDVKAKTIEPWILHHFDEELLPRGEEAARNRPAGAEVPTSIKVVLNRQENKEMDGHGYIIHMIA